MTDSLIRVMTVDDHPLMVAGLVGEINAQPDMEVVAEAADGHQALSQFRLHRPDITLMDLRMPNGDGIEAIRAIKAESADARIIVLSTFAGDMHAMQALRAGADGYLLKNTLRKELMSAIRKVHAGNRCIPAELAQRIAEHAVDETLTSREHAILGSLADGNSNKRIATQMGISQNTVNNHIKSILAKLRALIGPTLSSSPSNAAFYCAATDVTFYQFRPDLTVTQFSGFVCKIKLRHRFFPTEPPRDSRGLHFSIGLGHGKIESIFT